MRCNRKIPHTSYKDHVTNKDVRAKIQQAIRPHEDLLTIVKRCKLQWYRQVSHPSGLAKTILQGTVKGGRRQGRQRKRWEDNIREWTGLELTKSKRAVENRDKWRKLVVKSSVVPKWSSRLRYRWWWWWWHDKIAEGDFLIFLEAKHSFLSVHCNTHTHFTNYDSCSYPKLPWQSFWKWLNFWGVFFACLFLCFLLSIFPLKYRQKYGLSNLSLRLIQSPLKKMLTYLFFPFKFFFSSS